jgi:hypothetical protein
MHTNSVISNFDNHIRRMLLTLLVLQGSSMSSRPYGLNSAKKPSIIIVYGLSPRNKSSENNAWDTWRTPLGRDGRLWLRDDLPQSVEDNSMAASGDEHSQPAPSASLQPGNHNANKRHVTSSETPLSPEDGIARAATPEPLFYNYLRVLHDFDPSTDPSTNTDENSITVSIKQGDLILVHSIHENGWADGTLFSSGIRGWVPTNYCEVYDHPYIRNLLNGMTQFWDLLEESEAASLQIFIRQEYIRGLIAGVRGLLGHASCLHRDATLVQQNVGIRRTRKGLLADLSSMVSKAKELQEEAGQPYDEKIIHTTLDELISKAFRVVTRAVRFADAWTLEAMTRPRSDCSAKPDAALPAPLNLNRFR